MLRNPAIPANNRTGTIKDVEHIIFMLGLKLTH
jgi:phospholipase C